ncbi:hypothetical protein KEH51_11460 [[Brevibacterium] frigoritolerans]|uniref:Uncharacterized protein n=1 Tax=Peribacillus frigoritolerans TaxID=450367 RepID=A0A941FRG7_9BACI|nr:hypothetical protein [Peribacillus frigoritolerans]
MGLGGLFLSLISQSDAFLAFSVIGMVFYFISIFDLVVTSLRNPKSEEDMEEWQIRRKRKGFM